MESSSENETIEWDLPVSEVKQNGESNEGLDFTKLSIGTEIRSKIWEQEHRAMIEDSKRFTEDLNRLTAIANKSSRGRNIRYNDDVHRNRNNFRKGVHHYDQVHVTSTSNLEQAHFMQNDYMGPQSVMSSELSAYSPSFHPKLNEITGSSPNQSELSNHNEVEHDFGSEGDQHGMTDSNLQLLQKENQNLRDEISHLKCLVEELNENRCSSTNDRAGENEFPEPMRMALETVKLENSLRDKDEECRALKKKSISLETEIQKLRSTLEHEKEKHRLEQKTLSEKLEQKGKERDSDSDKNKNNRKDERSHGNHEDSRGLRERIKQLTEEKKELARRLEEVTTEYTHKESILHIDLHKHDLELQQYKETVNQYQSSDQTRKSEVERLVATARDTLEKERQEKYLLLVEQNKLKHKLEKMTETCKGLQIKNDEFSRAQNDIEQEVDSFRKLKKLIHEHGLPNHDQLILLQQQAETFKEDVLSERKDRERAQAQREKMRRDLEGAQARISSLQEQVYKYQEHIMQLNSEKHRSMGNSTKLQRQLSSPSFVNHRIVNNFDKTFMKHSPIGPMPTSPQGRQAGGPVGFDESAGRNRGFRPMYNNQGAPPRGFNDGRRGSAGSNGQFDNWQRPGNGNNPNRFHGNFNGISNKPRSPLLTSTGEHWQNQNQRNPPPPRQPFSQFNSPLGYNNGIWSQQQQPGSPLANPSGPCSPSGFGALPSSPVNPWMFVPDSQLDAPPVPLPVTSQGLKPFTSEPWSTASVDDLPITSLAHESVSNSEEKDARNDEFVCGKCEAKFNAADAFKCHLEKCFGCSKVN